MDSMASAASMAAEAPRLWPTWDLFADTGILGSVGPKTSLRQATSVLSPVGVEVPWTLTAPISRAQLLLAPLL